MTETEKQLEKDVCEILAFYKYTDDDIQAETTEEIARKVIDLVDKKAKEDILKKIDEIEKEFVEDDRYFNDWDEFFEELKSEISK